MRIVTGKGTEEVSAEDFRTRAAAYRALLLDIGTGDGALPYRLAADHPDVLFVGLDPNAEGMAANARKARRKPDRGGRPNCVYVAASIEEPPSEIAGLAQAITINFPWAALLEHVLGLRENAPGTLARALAALATPDCALQLLVNEVTDLPDLPAVDPVLLAARLTPALHGAGFGDPESAWLDPATRVRSRWGGRLIRGSGRRVVRLRAARGTPPDPFPSILDAIAT